MMQESDYQKRQRYLGMDVVDKDAPEEGVTVAWLMYKCYHTPVYALFDTLEEAKSIAISFAACDIKTQHGTVAVEEFKTFLKQHCKINPASVKVLNKSTRKVEWR